MANLMLRNKKRVGRGMKIGLGGMSCANTRHLKRILIYLKVNEIGTITSIVHGIGVDGSHVKDGLIFLIRVNLIDKFHISSAISSGYFYKLKDKTLYDKKN